MKHLLGSQRGFVMVTSLALLLMLGILGVSTVMKSSDDMEVTANQLRDLYALYSAEAGAEKAFALFTKAVRETNLPPDPLPSDSFNLERYQVAYRVDKVGVPIRRTLTTGAYQGLYALVQDYDIWGHARSSNTGVQNSVKIRMERALIPIFQFAIFYDDILEWHPGPVMNLSGRVHSNGDLYIGANSGLSIDSWMTSAGDIRHGRHPASGQSTGSGYVQITDKDGNYQDMENGDGTWLDHDESDWFNKSTERWGGTVLDTTHGVKALALPLEGGDDPINVIKDASGGNIDSYENKATLKIIDGQAYYKVGAVWNNVTAAMIAEGSLETATFYDSREGRTVDATQIDISALNTSPYWPSNGIIYTKDTQAGGDLKATRLVDGATLKEGLTVVSENPLFTEGNYNSVNKKPAALMADAYTILSNAWNDGASSGSLSGRVASTTTVNASFMTGNVPSHDGNYSGGVENFPRFLEKWSGKTLTWTGSMVEMWQSDLANSDWSYGSYYTAPNRDWHFDEDLLDPDNLPPGTPMVSAVIKRGWANTGGAIAEAP